MGKTDWSEAAMKTIILAFLVLRDPWFSWPGVAAVGFLDARPPASAGSNAISWSSRGITRTPTTGTGPSPLIPRTIPGWLARTCGQAISCLVQLRRVDEIDDFREAVIEVHKGNWRLLQAAAESYLNDPDHHGFIVAGKFHRGPHRGGGRYVSALGARSGPGLAASGSGAGSRAVGPRSPGCGPLLPHARRGPAARIGREASRGGSRA